ncbi:centrosomal protein of 126 kDa isoform X2 [Dromiciops gliroides]|uniref:centrosomal protein of 126 kDa isoform X2 n=1 Tax=Dromiciops gliroides TaxID=33562 RepID=UPI001CC4F75A|nr:centrosomal protein of 126 kDa isoform X2 [Dromiciops gliroides]
MLTGRPGARSPTRGPGTAPASPGPQWRSNFTQGNNLYQNMKIHLEKNLEEERQKLLQEQRICRSRARKYCIESNRRRKAFEEKRKKEEEKEHQIREQILQQRKQKLEEVTEKFQRAHIPPSQRRRTVYQKPIPRLEEALEQIQGFSLKQESNFSSSSRPTINWKTIDSAVASAVTRIEPMYQKHLSSRINCDREIQENSKINWAIGQEENFQHNLEETQHLLEEFHLNNVQDLHEEVNQLTNSETLSSIDSLEAGDHEDIYSTLSKALSSTTQQNSVSHNSQSPQPTNQVYFDAGELHLSKTQHINNWLINLGDQNTQTASPFPEFINKHNEHFNNPKLRSFALNRIGERSTDMSDNTVAVTHSPCTFSQDKKAEKTSETFSVWKVDSLSSKMLKRERPLVAESPTFRFSKTWTTLSPTTREIVQSSEHEKCPELTQPNRTTSVPASNIPMATPVVLPSSQWTNYKSTYSNIHSGSSSQKNNMHLEEICPIQCTDGLDSLKDIKDEKIKNFGSNNQALPFLFPDALSASFMCNNPDQMSVKDKNEKTVGTTPSLSNNSDLVGQPKKSKHNNHERNGVKLLKSILKKESKYENDYFKALIINRGFNLGNQTVATIRDSVELTKVKGKGSEIQKGIKKLRWFDEIGQIEKEDGEKPLKTGLASAQASSQTTYVQTKVSATSNINVHACAINSASYENHKDILGVMKYENPKDNSLTITKNAATQMSETDNVPLDSFVPSGKSFAKQAWITSKKEEGKFPVQNNDSKTQKTIPHSGIIKIIRRSRASKVQSVIASKNKKGTVIRPQTANEARKTQGKLIAPHPPHKPITNNRINKTVKDSQCQQVMPTKSQSSTVNSRNLGSRYVFPTENIFSHISQESNPSLWNTNSSDLVTPMPPLPSYRSSECQTSAKINHSVKGTQMIAQQDGSLNCAQRSPLYEENSHSLKPIEEKIGIQWKGEHSALGQNEKAADSTSARRKINFESNENKPRTLLEQRRQLSNSIRQKCLEQPQNIIHPMQLSSSESVQSLSGISHAQEVSESTAQFLMAENLVKSSIPEDKILTLMKPMQPYKPTLPLHKTQRLNIGALCFEEQKIIESLNHLNQRLHYVQEAICKNPSIKSILQIASPLNSQPWTTSLSIGRSISTEVQSQMQRKY